MKTIFRLFFKLVRIVLGPVMLAWEKLTTPQAVERSVEAQSRLDALTRGIVLYQYRTCPFCIKVRRTLAHLALNVERRDVQRDPTSRHELEQQGGQIKVPCLHTRYEDGREEWLYESEAIVRHLQGLAERDRG
jgi:glutaredoxin